MTQLTIPNVAVPAHLRNRGVRVALTDNIAGGLTTGGAFPKISIKASRFRIVKDGTESVLPVITLPTVVVGGNPRVSKLFYAAEFDGNAEATAPDCYSLDGIKPAGDSKNMQASLCATCPKNAWGSKITQQGKEVKACSDKKRLAVAAADDPEGDLYLLEVTPAAFKDFANYIKQLQMRGIALETVVTNIGFDPSASFPKLTFGFGGFLSEDQQNAVDSRLDDPIIQEITGEATSKAVEVAPAPAPKAAKSAPAPVEVVEPEVVEEEVPVSNVTAFGGGAKKAGAFGGAAVPPAAAKPAAAKPKAAPKPAPAPEPPAAKSSSLADEIAGLIGSMGDDD
jgi:hypothetical protein